MIMEQAFKIDLRFYDSVIFTLFYNDQDMDTEDFDICQRVYMNFQITLTTFYLEYVSDVKMFIKMIIVKMFMGVVG